VLRDRTGDRALESRRPRPRARRRVVVAREDEVAAVARPGRCACGARAVAVRELVVVAAVGVDDANLPVAGVGDPGAVRGPRGCGSVPRCELAQAAVGEVDDPEMASASPRAREDDLLPVGRPRRIRVGGAGVTGRDLVRITAVPAHDPDVRATVTVADEGDVRPVLGEGGRSVVRRIVREVRLLEVRVDAGGVDLVVPVAVGDVGDPAVIGVRACGRGQGEQTEEQGGEPAGHTRVIADAGSARIPHVGDLREFPPVWPRSKPAVRVLSSRSR
jgi:hypothetical protein